jgi:hypothetical protein
MPLVEAIFDSFRATPPLFRRPRFLNFFGLQAFRIILMNWWRLSPKKVSKKNRGYMDSLAEDGYLVLENFLTEEMLQKLIKQNDQYYEETKDQCGLTLSLKNIPLEEMNLFSQNQDWIREVFLGNNIISELVEGVTHRKINIPPDIYFWSNRRKDLSKEELSKMSPSTSTHNHHADVTYPAIKVWYFLNDIDSSNGGYQYAKGSHKLNFKRFLLDTRLSVEKGQLGNLSQELSEEFEIEAKTLIGKANTLLISNQMGFHRRGVFESREPRNTIFFDFRYLDSWKNNLFPFYKPLLGRLTKLSKGK